MQVEANLLKQLIFAILTTRLLVKVAEYDFRNGSILIANINVYKSRILHICAARTASEILTYGISYLEKVN